ncbi:unnamed protein product [Brachionus calyciflorus]|uniref:N-acetylgalactosaminide beta-1,3-galactosyltransferase n=1 Tax=Brachionus calyciflorus TaxID=104777 RepID=A0A814FN99_9BILA|nr:unnamed protein product [Brachionus calyciflorus]
MLPKKKNSSIFFMICFVLIVILFYSNLKGHKRKAPKRPNSLEQRYIVNEVKEITSSSSSATSSPQTQNNLPTVFCLIKTHPANIKINKTLNIYRVWGHKCDNYRFITLLPEELRPQNPTDTVEVFDNFYMIQPKGLVRENHDDLSLKLYYSMIYVYEKFPFYDWYYLVDDDAYVNVRNLKEFLKDKPSNESITYGYNFKVIVEGGYHSGGPGYALSNAAFVTVSKALKENINNCPNSGIDDVDVSACVRKYKGKKGVSMDEYGRERFLVLSLMTHFTGSYPDWLAGYSENQLQKGLNCCSDSLVAVHYMSPRDVFRLDLAIETQKNTLNLHDDYLKLGKNITFKNIIKNYIMLLDIEDETNNYKDLINFK